MRDLDQLIKTLVGLMPSDMAEEMKYTIAQTAVTDHYVKVLHSKLESTFASLNVDELHKLGRKLTVILEEKLLKQQNAELNKVLIADAQKKRKTSKLAKEQLN